MIAISEVHIIILSCLSLSSAHPCEDRMLLNIAFGKDTRQSSTRPVNNVLKLSFDSDHAVDGNNNTYSHTDSRGSSWWWYVDFTTPRTIDLVNIIFGPDMHVSSSDFFVEHGLKINSMTRITILSSTVIGSNYNISFSAVLAMFVKIVSTKQLQLIEVEVYNTYLTPETSEEILFQPSYISDWQPMKSNASNSVIHFNHGLGEFPVKVVVDVEVDDSGEKYYFTGIGSPETDDDVTDIMSVGGVACLYSMQIVSLYAINNNNLKTGDPESYQVIYIGDSQYWIGPNITRKYNEANVRVRVWRESDFPQPFFKSEWISLDVMRADETFYDWSHGMGSIPDLVIVQVELMKNKNIPHLFECQGSTSKNYRKNRWDGLSGCRFGFSDLSVRIWIPAIDFTAHVCLFSLTDGYGGKNNGVGCARRGKFQIKVWKLYPKIFEHNFETEELTSTSIFNLPFDIAPTHHFVTVAVIVNEGVNEKYHFYGVGSTSNDGHHRKVKGSGGLIHGYSRNQILFWIPKAPYGHVFSVGGLWGNGTMAQSTNNTSIKIAVWHLHDRDTLSCPVQTFDRGNISESTFRDRYIYQSRINLECHEGYNPINGQFTTSCARNCLWDTTISCQGCPCQCEENQEQIKQSIKILKETLTVKKEVTSKNLRSLVSASDDRISATAVGYVGVALLSLAFGLIVLMDIPLVLRHIWKGPQNC